MKKRRYQYELQTSSQESDEMPFALFAGSRKEALSFAKKRKMKGEKILSLKRSW